MQRKAIGNFRVTDCLFVFCMNKNTQFETLLRNTENNIFCK